MQEAGRKTTVCTKHQVDAMTVSRYYRDPRDRYPSRNDRYDQPYSRDWPGPSRTRSPEGRREEEDRYYMERRDREMALRERERYDDRRRDAPYLDRDRERDLDRRAPYPPRRTERDREHDYYDRDRVPPPSRPQWGARPPMDRLHSPLASRHSPPTSHRLTSPYSSSRPPRSPPHEGREEYNRRSSHAVGHQEMLPRDEGIPTGPRAAGYGRMNGNPPTGPRSSYVRPPPPSSKDSKGGAGITSAQPREETVPKQPSKFSDSWSDDGDKPAPPSEPTAPPAASDGASGWDDPTKEKTTSDSQSLETPAAVPTPSVTSAAPTEIPKLPVKDRLGQLEESDFVGSSHPVIEAEAFNVSTARLRSIHSMHSRPEFIALRKALYSLADCELELAGAKMRTSITQAALDAAREDAEAWSLESARIEINERNGGVQGWLDARQTNV